MAALNGVQGGCASPACPHACRVREHGARLNAHKCKFPHPSERAYLATVTYYHNASTAMAPLYQLLRKEAQWEWGPCQQQAFNKVKDLLKSTHFLAHFDPRKPLILECNASPQGIGAVLSHNVGGGVLRPIGFRSRLLAEAEKNYSQLEREALARVFGASKFRHYLLGNPFTMKTGNKPLVACGTFSSRQGSTHGLAAECFRLHHQAPAGEGQRSCRCPQSNPQVSSVSA